MIGPAPVVGGCDTGDMDMMEFTFNAWSAPVISAINRTGLLKPASAAIVAVTTRIMVIVPAMLLRIRGRGWLRWPGRPIRAFDDLVKFAAIEPNAAALRAIIDFHALTLRHDERGFYTDRTFHACLSIN